MIQVDQLYIEIEELGKMEKYLHSTSSDICIGNIVPRKNMVSMMDLFNMRKL